MAHHDQGTRPVDPPDYLANAEEWLSHIGPIIARHQLTNGTGPVIACQVENEFYENSSTGQQYMQHLKNKMPSDGITVPLTGNGGLYGERHGWFLPGYPDAFWANVWRRIGGQHRAAGRPRLVPHDV